MTSKDWSEKLGGILVGGFGPEVVNGVIAKYLERIPVDRCHIYIEQNSNLLDQVTEKQWSMVRKAASVSKVEISYAEVVRHLNKNRPDILAVISCTDGGVGWLQRQVEEAKKHLAS